VLFISSYIEITFFTCIAFFKVTLSKANSVDGGAQKLDSLVFQDLVTGDGPILELGDSVELKYTGWLFDNGTVGTVSILCIIFS